MGQHERAKENSTFENTRPSGFGFRWMMPIDRHPEGKPEKCRCEEPGKEKR